MIEKEADSLTHTINPFIIIWVILAVIIGVAHQKFQECKYRLPWLYIFLAYLFGTIIISQQFVAKINHHVPFMFIAIASLVLIVAIHFIKQGSPIKYIVFLAWFVCMCFLLPPIIMLAKNMDL